MKITKEDRNDGVLIIYPDVDFAKVCAQQHFNRKLEGKLEWVEDGPGQIIGIDPTTKEEIYKIRS